MQSKTAACFAVNKYFLFFRSMTSGYISILHGYGRGGSILNFEANYPPERFEPEVGAF